MIGPGGVGKTSFLHGLKNEPLPPANSTQLAEASTVRPQKWNRAAEGPESPWTEVTEDDETDEIVGLVQLVSNATSGKSGSSRFVNTLQTVAGIGTQYFRRRRGGSGGHQEDAVTMVEHILSRAVRHARRHPGAQAPDSEVMLHVWDCGGQPVFLDVLPPFLTSKTMFMLMFDASKNLHEKCVATSHQDGAVVREEQYHDTTTMQLLLQWMASIHATLAKKNASSVTDATTKQSSEVHQDVAQDSVPPFPRILPIGTHGGHDSVRSRKEDILKQVNSECEDKAFAYLLRPGVIVDNTTAGSGENEDPAFKQARREVYNFAKNLENLKIPTPITWVLFRKIFKRVAAKKPVISLKEVTEIAIACGVREGAVGSVLKFYHELAVFLQYSHIQSMKQYVIGDVQWLINHLAKILALEGFEEKKSSLLWKPLREKGILLRPLCEEVWRGSGLPVQSLIDLMEDFLILAPISSKVYSQHPGEEYFLPSVLQPYNFAQEAASPAMAIKKAAPLHLRFNTKLVPPGFFTRLATLLAKEPKCHVLFEQEVYRNRISILYGEQNNRIDKVTISQLPSSVQVEVTREQPRLSHQPNFSSTCREILKLIQECAVSILEWLPGIKVSPAFICDQCSSDQSSTDKAQSPKFVEILPNSTTRSRLLCEKLHTAFTETQSHDQCYWLKVSPKEEDFCGSPVTASELDQLVQKVPGDKVKELVESLEMTSHLRSEDHTNLKMVLGRWSIEMHKIGIHVRSNLVHCLRLARLEDLAEMLKFGQLTETVASAQATKPEPQVPLTEEDLLQCSRFMEAEKENLSSLASMLSISDSELDSIRSRYKRRQGQAYQLLHMWYSRSQGQQKRNQLLTALKATNFSPAAKRLEVSKAPDLHDLLKYVRTAKWYRLGLCIGVNPKDLEIIDHDAGMVETKLRRVFIAWLDKGRDCTWKKVVQALIDLELNVLASDIKDKFC